MGYASAKPPAPKAARPARPERPPQPPQRQLFGENAAGLGRALAIGAAGGLGAHALGAPLAFMLGSLFAAMAASLAGLRLAVPNGFRAGFLALVGLFLGEAFSAPGAPPSAGWAFSLGLAMLYAPLAGWAGYLFYRHIAGIEPRTALFCAIPGGLSAVILISGEVGADERRVALAQSLRIAIVVLAAPALFFGALGQTPPTPLGGPAETLVDARDLAWLAAGSGLAVLAMRAIGAPLPALIAPLLASAALRMGGLVEGVLPFWLVETALVVTGASIGARFAGADLRMLGRLAGWTAFGTALLMAISALFALVVSAAMGVSFIAALLAFAPGGVAEMALIALALGADPAFVAAHHLARIGFILLSAPLFAAWVRRWGGDEKDSRSDKGARCGEGAPRGDKEREACGGSD